MRVRAFLFAVLTAVATLAVAAVPTGAAPSAAGPGEVCFWTKPGQMGEGWCYRPGGYAELPGNLHDNAYSVRSDYNGSVWAIDWTRHGCVFREIRAYEFDDNWDWGNKIDGVDSSRPADCQPG
ncbi:hypothetical protein GCM10010400_17970 [Streptomyces aculeolatus]|uniref:hypothetical protein n=1 Tax=Streptomyces aculeolatus TaxID=270689 RepID=UPI001CECC679|nr:hypothetical protein [Streptomyces aculeolatus]